MRHAWLRRFPLFVDFGRASPCLIDKLLSKRKWLTSGHLKYTWFLKSRILLNFIFTHTQTAYCFGRRYEYLHTVTVSYWTQWPVYRPYQGYSSTVWEGQVTNVLGGKGLDGFLSFYQCSIQELTISNQALKISTSMVKLINMLWLCIKPPKISKIQLSF